MMSPREIERTNSHGVTHKFWGGRASESSRSLMARAGLPATTVQAGTSRVTTDWAPTTAPTPMTTPGATKARAQTHACGEMTIGAVTSRIFGSEMSWVAVQSITYWDTVAWSPISSRSTQ